MPKDLSYICPSCGHEVRVGGTCKGCQKKRKPAPAKSKRPQRHDEMYDGLDLPDEDFDYDDFVAREFGQTPHRKLGVKWYWWLLGALVLTLWVISSFR